MKIGVAGLLLVLLDMLVVGIVVRTDRARRLFGALRRYWKRILVGASVGWLLSTVIGAFVLAWLLVRGVMSMELSDTIGAALVLSGTTLGGVIGYATRR